MTPEKDQAMAIGNMHKNLVKIMHVVPEISSQTDRHMCTHTEMYSSQNSQYFATAPLEEIINGARSR